MDRAVEAYTEAVRLDRRNHRFSFELAETYAAMGQLQPAAELYRDVFAEAGNPAVVRRAGQRAIQLHQSLGRLEELLTAWEQANLVGERGPCVLE